MVGMGLYNLTLEKCNRQGMVGKSNLVEVEMRARVDDVVVGGHIDDLHSVVKVEGDGLCVGGAPLLYLEGPLDGLCCEESWKAKEEDGEHVDLM